MSLHSTTAQQRSAPRRGSSAGAMPGPPEQLDSGAAEPVPTRTPGVRITPLGVLVLIAVIVFLHWAQAVLIPITLAIMLSYALTPVVGWLKKRARLPKAAGAALTLAVLLGGLGTGISSLQPEALDVLDTIPQAAQKLNLALHSGPPDPAGLSEKIKRAAREIENIANASDAAAPASRRADGGVPKNVPEAHRFRVRDYVMLGTASLITGTGAALATIALVYLLLVAGDTFRRTLVRTSGVSVSEKKLTVQMLDEIEMQIQRYLLVQIAMGILMGVVAWVVFASVGLDNALFWAFMGGVLHLIPYAGPTLFVALSGLVAYMQFDSLQPVVIMVGELLATLGLIALLLVPWLTQHIGRINAVIVLVTLLLWGWLWGVWGLLLGVPMVMAVKAICERFEDLQPISEFLGYRPKSATVLAPVDRYRTRQPDDSAK
jgi:predicted PurR-regulated permease PerM